MILRLRTRTHRTIDLAVDRSLTRLRVIIGLIALTISVRSLFGEVATTAVLGCAAAIALLALAVAEPAMRRRIGATLGSALVVAFDTIVVLAVLGIAGVRPGEVESLLVLLPLTEAGLRHGVLGVLLTWIATSLAVAGQVLVDWNGSSEQIKSPAGFCVLVALVTLPSANVSDFLSDWVHRVGLERLAARRQSDRLADVMSGNMAVTDAPPTDRAQVVLTHARRLIDDPAFDDVIVLDRFRGDVDLESVGSEAYVVDLDGSETVRISTGLGATPILSMPLAACDDEFVVQTLELLCLTARTLGTSAASPDTHTTSRRFGFLDRVDIQAQLATRLAVIDEQVEVAVISLDNLKLLNDLYGHAAGDALLTAAHERLHAMGRTVQVGRLSGDTLLVVADQTDTALLAEIDDALTGSVDLGVHGRTSIHHGIGCAVATDPGQTGPELVRLATQSMFDDRRVQNEAFLTRVEAELAGVEADR